MQAKELTNENDRCEPSLPAAPQRSTPNVPRVIAGVNTQGHFCGSFFVADQQANQGLAQRGHGSPATTTELPKPRRSGPCPPPSEGEATARFSIPCPHQLDLEILATLPRAPYTASFASLQHDFGLVYHDKLFGAFSAIESRGITLECDHFLNTVAITERSWFTAQQLARAYLDHVGLIDLPVNGAAEWSA